jgi:ferredoxin-type protein NapH
VTRGTRARTWRWTRWRRASQAAIVIFYLVLPVLAVVGYYGMPGTLAALKLGPVDLVEPAAGLSAIVAAGSVGLTLLVGMLPVVVLALVAGPVFCSWVCPWGAGSEWLDARRHRGRRRVWPGRPWEGIRRLRAGTLGLGAAAAIALGVPVAAWLSAPRLVTTLPIEMIFLRDVSLVTGGLLAGLLVFELVGPRRLWCRALCPVGALANYLRTPRTLTVGYRAETCNCPRLPLCHLRCQWGIDPRAMGRFDGCTNCFACVDGCPTGSLSATTRGPARAAGVTVAPRPPRRVALGA